MWSSIFLCVLLACSISAQIEVIKQSPNLQCWYGGGYTLGWYWNNGNQIGHQSWIIRFTTGPDIHRLSRFETKGFDAMGTGSHEVILTLHEGIPGSLYQYSNNVLGSFTTDPTAFDPNTRYFFDLIGTGLDIPLTPSTTYGLYVNTVPKPNQQSSYIAWSSCNYNTDYSSLYTTDAGYSVDAISVVQGSCTYPCSGDLMTGVWGNYWSFDFSISAELDNIVQSSDPASASVSNFCNTKKTVDITVPQGRYFLYKNFNGDFRSYIGILTNANAAPKTVSRFIDTDGAYSVISYSTYPPADPNAYLSRFDFSVPSCGDFFGPEVYVPSCNGATGTLRFDNLFPSTNYYLYAVNDFADSVSGSNYDLSFSTTSQTTETVTYNTFSEKYILVSKNAKGDITSKIQVVNINFVSFTSDVLPDNVVKGWYRFITITAVAPLCTTTVSCKFDNILVDAIPMDANKYRCFTPPLSSGSHTFAIFSNGALYPAKTIQVDDHSSYVDSDIVPFDNVKATIKWNASETTAYLGSSRIEAFTYVQSGPYLKFTQVGGAIANVAATLSSYLWTVPANLQFLVIRTTFRRTNSANYAAQSWVMIDCHTAYCGRREFCNRYYGSQPVGTSSNALTPVDQNCQNLAYCLSEVGCVGTCTSNFISGLSNFALNRPFNNNPYALGNPASSTNTQSDIDWVKIATQLYGKNFDVIFREDYPPKVCPVKPVLDHPVQSTICGDPHFSIGNGVTFDIQEVGEFNWFTGFVQFQDSGNPTIDFSVQPTIIDIQLTWYVPNSISFLTGMSFKSRENPNGAFVLSTKGGVLTAYDNGVPVTPNGQVYYFVGGNVKLTASGAEIFLNDGIQISAQYWFNLICATITVSGVFKDISGIYGSVTPIPGDNQNNQGSCGGQNFLVPKPFFNHNTQLADCTRVPQASSAFYAYGLGVDNAGQYARQVMGANINIVEKPKRMARDNNPLCDSITNAYFQEMCNRDLPIMEEESGISAADLFEKMNEAALNLDLPSAVSIAFSFDRNGNNLDVSYVATINGFETTSAVLNLRSSHASVYNLDASSPWVDEAPFTFVGTTTGQFSIVDAGCDVIYFVSGKVDIDTSSSGWKSDSYSITGNCVEASAPPEDVTPDSSTSNDLTTQELSTSPITTGEVTSHALTTQQLTTQPLTTHALTTDFLTVASRCATYNFATIQGYFCSADQKGYYQCLSGPYSSQSSYRTCAPGTFCRCATGVECSPYGVCTF